MSGTPLFQSFFMGGLECSSHRLRSGKRLDMLASTNHDRFVEADFQRLREQGICTIRSGIRWHLIESQPGHYDFSSVLPMIHAAQRLDMQVMWDICHYGWPDDLDIFTPEFVRRFARFATAFARILKDESESIPFLSPINEISFWAWGGGDAAYLNPFQRGRGYELKVQLVRAAIEAIEAIWSVLPQARIVHIDPVINIMADLDRPHEIPPAAGHHQAQYQAWDMLAGRSWPLLGGNEKYLDIIGVNYYSNNQWIHNGPPVDWHHSLYRPLRQILREVYERYERPLFIAETGIENGARPDWLRYVCQEATAVIEAGVPLEGICLYPIINHAGWDDDRHCHNGLWDYADAQGNREIYEPLRAELAQQRLLIATALKSNAARAEHRAALVTGVDKPRLCVFTDSLEPSGMGEHMLALALELHSRYDITFICPQTPASEALLRRARELPIHVMPLEVRGQNRVSWEQLRDWLGTNCVDIFHSHAGIGWEGHDAVHAAYFAGVPIILRTEHLPYLITDGNERHVHQALMRRIQRLICVSAGAYRSFLDAGFSPEQLAIIRNGVVPRLGTATRRQMRSKLHLPENFQLVLTVGRLTEQKGYQHLLQAIPNILAACPNTRFLWVGDGPLAESLNQMVKSQGLSQSVSMLGQRSDIANLLAAADLFVLPSLFEGLPLVVLEAMAAGVPIVATDIPGTQEILVDGVNGRLIPPANAEALGKAIAEALGNPTLRQQWSASARADFAQQFTAKRMADEVDMVYRELLQQADILPLLRTQS